MNFQEHDMSVELYNQHAAISDLQQTEEEVADHHQKVNEFLMKFLPESRELYKLMNYVDYDQDGKFVLLMAYLHKYDNVERLTPSQEIGKAT